MYILAFETSCDDTSVAIFEDKTLLSMETQTQIEHDITGGVVPEVAARSHANALFPCLQKVLKESRLELPQIDLIACTREPWLLPSLLTGMTVAKTLSLAYDKKLLWINHIEAHIFANLLERDLEEIIFPNIVLTVSGWHTELYLWKSLFDLTLIGTTRDDAAGECFDKVGKMLGLGFPAGAKIAKHALLFRETASMDDLQRFSHLFPRSLLEKDSLDFSFSWTKSAIKRYIDAVPDTERDYVWAISYATEEAITDALVEKLFRSYSFFWVQQVCLAGWVSANFVLRDKIQARADAHGLSFLFPKKAVYSMDNAAMVGIRAWYEVNKSHF
jgi:N6-L-threonylcarbamoyladenine synthase